MKARFQVILELDVEFSPGDNVLELVEDFIDTNLVAGSTDCVSIINETIEEIDLDDA